MHSAAQAAQPPRTLFHYTDQAGHDGIVASMKLNPSLRANNPKDARYGDGQYLSDIRPGTKTLPELSYAFVAMPFAGARFTHFVEIDVTGLNVVKVPDRKNVFLIPGVAPLDLEQRIVSTGKST